LRRLRAAPLLYGITLVRLITFRSAICERSVRIWSCTPSAKYAFCFSLLRLLNGSTATLFAGSGNQNVALGFLAGSNTGNGGGNIYIGAQMLGDAGDTNQTYIANIGSTNVSGAGTDTVTVNLTTGLIGHLTSSRRYKEEIKPMGQASETLFGLKPVTFRYKKEVDRSQALSFGLIAEEVAEISPDLITCDKEGKPETVRYEAVNAMLLNEFLKEHLTVQEQGATIARLEKQIDVLTAGLQKVSAQLEASKSVSQVAESNQ
jgi:hypothetical protein